MFIKRSLLISLLIISSVALALSFKIHSHFADKPASYAALWKRVDSCEMKGLTDRALKIVDEIYKKSKNENNGAQLVKSVIHRMKYSNFREEFSQEKNINALKEEVKSAAFPAKPVLQSLLAEAYWQYYQNNRYKFYNRSQTVGFNNEDVATFDLKAITNAVIFNYRASLSDSILLQKTRIELIEEVITAGTSSGRQYRPTLYDFIAHRALDFFKNSEAQVTKAANQFSVNDERYLMPYTEFLQINIQKPQDSLDLSWYAINLFKQLTLFQINTNNEAGLADLEIERITFINSQSKHPLKDSLYAENLKWLVKRFESTDRVAEIKHMQAVWLLTGQHEYKPLVSDQYKWNKKQALEICINIIKTHPGTRGAQMAQNTINGIREKSITIEVEKVNDLQLPNRALVNYTNLDKVFFKLVKTDFFEFQKLQYNSYDKGVAAKLFSRNAVQSFEVDLPSDQDYNAHGVEVKVPATNNGYYLLIASDSQQFSPKEGLSCYQLYIVSDLSYLHKNKPDGSYEMYVLNRQSGAAIKNVNAQVWFNTYNNRSSQYEFTRGKSYTSDDKGFVNIVSAENESNNFYVELTNGTDKLMSDGNFYPRREYENNNPVMKSYIFTDRAIYRPGQTIYFKSIVLNNVKNKNEILTGQKVTVYFYDVNREKIASQELTTNEYGTVSGSFTAPQGVLTGMMEITDGYGSVSVSVEEYKRPKFETQFDTLKGSYKLNEEVSVKGFARAYAGNMIDNASVKYRVVRSANYPEWWYWYKPYYNFSTAQVEIANGTLTTNEKGIFEIRFKALPDPTADKNDNPVYTYEIFADVTDVNGETRTAQSSFRVGYQALQLEFSAPAVFNVANLPKVSLTAVNLNGVEEFVAASLDVYELKQPEKVFRKRLWPQPDKHLFSKEEYYKLFPNDLYEDETNQYKWEKSKKIFSKTFDTKNSKNILINDFGQLRPGVYVVEGICRDKDGQEVKSFNYITVYDPNSAALPVRVAEWTYASKIMAEPGEMAELIVASVYKDVYCIFDLESEGRREVKFISPSIKPMTIAVNESDRGGMIATTHFIRFGRIYSFSQYISVPFSNKDLTIEYATFRNRLLPGEKEEWTLKIKNKKGDKAAAEMLATLYDASLDAFKPNSWNFNIYNSFYPRSSWSHSLEDLTRSFRFNNYKNNYVSITPLTYDVLNYFGMSYYLRASNIGGRALSVRRNKAQTYASDRFLEDANEAPEAEMAYAADGVSAPGDSDKTGTTAPQAKPKTPDAPPRKNFNETAFFYPQLQTNDKGEVIIRFTIPESLTKWKFMGLAHTKDLSYGQTQNDVITQKELMVVPNAPRFFRENDRIVFATKISNLSQGDLSGSAELKFYDAFTDKEISTQLLFGKEISKSFSVKKAASTQVEWVLTIPEGLGAIKYRVSAKAGNFSDGEEMAVPVLTNKMLVTESMPLPVRGNQTKDFNFAKFISQNNQSTTLKNHAYTIEFTANPAWYAVQSLPYLMEYPYECAEQVFSRYYANALATHIANSKPKIRQIFDSWKTKSPESFLSNLEKNQELKSVLLQETPWLLDAKNETENKKRIALLFDMNKMSTELNTALIKLQKMQGGNGGWPWFSGCPEDWYITQHIVTGLAHLEKLGVINTETDPAVSKMLKSALGFCDRKLQEHYLQTKRAYKDYESNDYLDDMAIQYLYMRSYFKDGASANKDAVSYYKKQSQKYWLSKTRYLQAMVALSTNRYADKKTAVDILRSLKSNAIENEEMGMYWKENYGNYYWYQAPIESQALMIEAFDEVLGDTKSVDDLKTWLIKSKQTQNWSTTRATTEAIYALLLQGSDWLATEPNVEIRLGDIILDPKKDPALLAEAGTGYFKKTFSGADIQPALGNVKVVKKDAGVSWGAVYWQYFEQLDKITPHETPLKLSKKLFVENNTASGPVITPISSVSLKVGDKVKVRIELRVDRDMQYVHLKDMRASGFEPVNVFSGYRYQDGLGYYESTGDAATNFFISYLPKGNYVFEYPVTVSHKGDFSNGVSSIQCMYAPEYTSHSDGIRVTTGK